MTEQEIQKLDEADRLWLARAGLEQAMLRFPSDVLVAVITAKNIRDSFGLLLNADSAVSGEAA
ncbi:MAG: hypothetical protein H7238_16660 [Polaromonas sp.]|nr:hypothetical protein [Polaromonas sp.]